MDKNSGAEQNLDQSAPHLGAEHDTNVQSYEQEQARRENILTPDYRKDYEGTPKTSAERPARMGNLLYALFSEQKADDILKWWDDRKARKAGKHVVGISQTAAHPNEAITEFRLPHDGELQQKSDAEAEASLNALRENTVEMPVINDDYVSRHGLDDTKPGKHRLNEDEHTQLIPRYEDDGETQQFPKVNEDKPGAHSKDNVEQKV